MIVSCDGPNVNKVALKFINESILTVHRKSLIDFGMCSLRKIRNSFLYGLEKFRYNVINLIVELFHNFDGWFARWEDFKYARIKLVPLNIVF